MMMWGFMSSDVIETEVDVGSLTCTAILLRVVQRARPRAVTGTDESAKVLSDREER